MLIQKGMNRTGKVGTPTSKRSALSGAIAPRNASANPEAAAKAAYAAKIALLNRGAYRSWGLDANGKELPERAEPEFNRTWQEQLLIDRYGPMCNPVRAGRDEDGYIEYMVTLNGTRHVYVRLDEEA